MNVVIADLCSNQLHPHFYKNIVILLKNIIEAVRLLKALSASVIQMDRIPGEQKVFQRHTQNIWSQ